LSSTLSGGSATLSCAAVEGAQRYEFVIETVDGNNVRRPYTSYLRDSPSKTFWPQTHGVTYVWRVRSEVSDGWTAFSGDASFFFP
jgi:hypothetical protein